MTVKTDSVDIGTHLKIKFAANSFLLRNEGIMKRFLLRMAYSIEAKPLRDPIVENVAFRIRELGGEPFANEGGISGFVLLSVSHIACHTWPVHDGKNILDVDGEAVLDIYSCRPFEKKTALSVLKETYSPSSIQCKQIPINWEDENV